MLIDEEGNGHDYQHRPPPPPPGPEPPFESGNFKVDKGMSCEGGFKKDKGAGKCVRA